MRLVPSVYLHLLSSVRSQSNNLKSDVSVFMLKSNGEVGVTSSLLHKRRAGGMQRGRAVASYITRSCLHRARHPSNNSILKDVNIVGQGVVSLDSPSKIIAAVLHSSNSEGSL